MLNLSSPTILPQSTLLNNPALTSALATFIVKVFNNQHRNPELFDLSILRFNNPDELLAELGPSGIMCVMFDQDESGPSTADGKTGGRIVACAGAIPWDGNDEDGWALKTVCVDWQDKYAKKGLAVRTVECIARYLAKLPTEEERLGNVTDSKGGVPEEGPAKKTLTLWLTTEECLNGEYWRRRGFAEVRRASVSGMWAIRDSVSIDVVTMRKDLSFPG